MANLTKGQRAAEEKIKASIYKDYKDGRCDSEGNAVKNEHGIFVKKSRILGNSVVKRTVYPRRRTNGVL